MNFQKNKYRTLNDWFKTPQGRFLQSAMSEKIVSVRDKLRGTTLLQIGMCGENTWLESLPFHRKWVITPCLDILNTSLISTPDHLPFDRNSIDCVIAPLLMEVFGRDKSALNEIDRVLKPMGHIIFIGVNPISLWGLFLRLGYLDCFGGEKATLTSSLILKQTLLNQGYRQRLLDTFYYIPPVKSSCLIENLIFLNEMGKMIAPNPSGFYCLIMQKYQLSPIGLTQRRKKQRIRISQPAAGLARSNCFHE